MNKKEGLLILIPLFFSFVLILSSCGGGGGDGGKGGGVTSSHWAKSYGGSYFEGANSIQQTNDGGYIVAGWTSSFGGPWIIKLDSNGNIQWQKTYGESGFNYDANSIRQTNDGGYIVAGTRRPSVGVVTSDFWVIKLDSNGNVLWSKTYDRTGGEEASSIQQTSDGGYIIVGTSCIEHLCPIGAGPRDFWVIKLDPSGNILWQKTYGEEGAEGANSIQQTSDGGYIVAGWTTSFGVGGSDFWIIKLDSIGGIMWQRTYGGTGNDSAFSIQQTNDGGYIVAGETNSFGAGNTDLCVLKLDLDGNIKWQKTYGEAGYEWGGYIQQTIDGGYIMTGTASSAFWIIKMDSNGAIIWQKSYAMTYRSSGSAIQQTSDGGYVAGGWMCLSRETCDLWVLRLRSNGTISPTAPPNIGADTSATVQDTSVIPSDTSVAPADSTATVTDTTVIGVDTNAMVQIQASD